VSDSWTAVPDEAWDRAVEAVKARDGKGTAMLSVLVALYRLGRNAIHLGQMEVDEAGRSWFPVGSRLLADRSSVAANHVRKCVRGLVETGLLEIRSERRKRPYYHLKLRSPSVQMGANLHTSVTHSATTGYSSETHKESLTTLKKKTRQSQGTALRGADPRRARFLEKVKAWRPYECRPGLVLVDHKGSLLKPALDAIDKKFLLNENRIDLGDFWKLFKEHGRTEDHDHWGGTGLYDPNNGDGPGIMLNLHEAKPSMGWFQDLWDLIHNSSRDVGSDFVGFVITSKISFKRYLDVPSHWDFKVHDEASCLNAVFENELTEIKA
jgi:hypothetical protein